MGLLTAPTGKNLNFKNSRWRTGAILKTVKSPSLCNRSTDFNDIWHGDAYWSPAPDVKLNFSFSTIFYGGQRIENLLKYSLQLNNGTLHNFDNKRTDINIINYKL